MCAFSCTGGDRPGRGALGGRLAVRGHAASRPAGAATGAMCRGARSPATWRQGCRQPARCVRLPDPDRRGRPLGGRGLLPREVKGEPTGEPRPPGPPRRDHGRRPPVEGARCLGSTRLAARCLVHSSHTAAAARERACSAPPELAFSSDRAGWGEVGGELSFTSDGGSSWHPAHLGAPVAWVAREGSETLAVTWGRWQLWSSTGASGRWRLISAIPVAPKATEADITLGPAPSDAAVATSHYGDAPPLIAETTDGGRTWQIARDPCHRHTGKPRAR
jgi:hypothetical protein